MTGVDLPGNLYPLAKTYTLASLTGGGELPATAGPNALERIASSITNDRGESLYDIRAALVRAVADALEGVEEPGQVRDAVRDAIDGVLEEHGFDPAEVRGAMQDHYEQPPILFDELERPSASRSGLAQREDPTRTPERRAERIVESFLQGFRPGVHLDLEV